MQASASGVLEEVKRKKTDLKSLLDLAETLRELRTMRKEASRKKGEILASFPGLPLPLLSLLLI